jgi:signal transduction histidine kinase
MSKEVIDTYLFQAFARPQQQQHGRGLGLHIVKSVIDQSGGEVDVKSTPGEGSVFIYV